jgi:hypothetical protein
MVQWGLERVYKLDIASIGGYSNGLVEELKLLSIGEALVRDETTSANAHYYNPAGLLQELTRSKTLLVSFCAYRASHQERSKSYRSDRLCYQVRILC